MDSNELDKRKVPNEIFIQAWGDYEPFDGDGKIFEVTEDVTWCDEAINESDVKYIRADLVKELK